MLHSHNLGEPPPSNSDYKGELSSCWVSRLLPLYHYYRVGISRRTVVQNLEVILNELEVLQLAACRRVAVDEIGCLP